MKYLILGGSGFIGSNLIIYLLNTPENSVISFSRNEMDKEMIRQVLFKNNLETIVDDFQNADFDLITKDIDIVIHLVSTTIPSNSNYRIDLTDNVLPTIDLLNSCVKNNIKKFIFISSGGTVYGNTDLIPISEDHVTNPICSYGIQKLMIEKYIMLFQNNHGLESKIIRLANPYGPYQEIASGVGAITNFTLKCINKEPLVIFGDGNVVRDYIYIDDAIEGIVNIINLKSDRNIYNLGTGVGSSLNEIIAILKDIFQYDIEVFYKNARNVDVVYNVLNTTNYSNLVQSHNMTTLREGIEKLIKYFDKKRV